MNSTSSSSRPDGSRKLRILIVDDDAWSLAATSCGLQDIGYDTIVADSGLQALRQLAAVRPDFAIIDINMPGMSGFKLAGRLRELGEIPFMFLSGENDAASALEASARGAVAYLVKPQSVTQLAPAIAVGLARAAEVSALRQEQSALAGAFDAARDTNRAVGVLMERHQLDAHQAFDTLRSRARAARRKVNAIAAELLGGGTATPAVL